MIRHTVVFTLKHAEGSREEKDFMEAALKLSSIEGVHHFECLRQISKKNAFTLGLSMKFETKKAYDEYNNHPEHLAFIENFWIRDVEDFMEIDY
ncbi:MAG TPA: Dabb family protein, partial [Puia sp.]|nr:Dabb family protein [Puia sp.]